MSTTSRISLRSPILDTRMDDLANNPREESPDSGANRLTSFNAVPVLGLTVNPERNSDDGSDADSDLEELQGDIAKFDESVREFLASHHGSSDNAQVSRGGARGRGARGPRKAAKPRGDITARLSRVNQAFLGGDYDQALDLAFEVIRINAETHQAWTVLASIFRERGENDRALSAMVYAAHLRPKDVSGWVSCASFALDTIAENEAGNLHTARLCFSAALRAEPTHLDSRLGKAAVCHRQGHFSAAISEYKLILKRRPYDLDTVRKLAEACVDSRKVATAVPSAIQAYREFFDHEANLDRHQTFLWHDIGVYVELFASAERYQEGICQLKSLSRWLVGRSSEHYWDGWTADDREWDAGAARRSSVPEFDAINTNDALYGEALPRDLRIRLATYRLRLGHESEALLHMEWLNPSDAESKEFAIDFPFLVYELATELAHCGRHSQAIKYYELLRAIPGDPDPATLLQLGRCYLTLEEQPTAEECFLAAIDVDEDSIDARIELANMYERAREDEEALILAAEAMALREARDLSGAGASSMGALTSAPLLEISKHGLERRRKAPSVRPKGKPTGSKDDAKKPVIPKRYRAKRLAGPDKRLQDEQARAVKLSHQYEVVRDLKRKILAGRNDLLLSWMSTSQELVDDFRSLKRFYTWDKYLGFLGSRGPSQVSGVVPPDSELSQMYERLTRSIAPHGDQHGRELGRSSLMSHEGISFEDWLDLFLDYAIALAILHRREEAYQICQAAKDSTVFQSSEHGFAIYVAWSVCAIYTGDEERCVATARYLMRDGAMTDSYRMFALLSRLCQSPVSWYTSGPAQKFILRQIKAIDARHDGAMMQLWEHGRADGGVGDSDLPTTSIDVCLLMLYGHILFTSTSYAYSLG
ncbi:Transcription factor tau subunit sfc4 [Drechmeria coniospora]|uniref:Transcription factor tau subunit sfc4 n=1 Tax=Drechmeria coniospora TaxID=98403 RepID=A0A151GBQ6_DRECN|nr:Transcription factor tau subunit sfc4 [Drechmeria coniospora]KYK54539.1 Transcription factor tau subunit sfc4 [Drechmeria coniospora]